MFRSIKVAAICAMFFTGSAFADADDWGYRQPQHERYENGYDQNYGGGYARQMQFSAPQHYSRPSEQYYGYAQQMPRYRRHDMDDRRDRDDDHRDRDGRW